MHDTMWNDRRHSEQSVEYRFVKSRACSTHTFSMFVAFYMQVHFINFTWKSRAYEQKKALVWGRGNEMSLVVRFTLRTRHGIYVCVVGKFAAVHYFET